MHTFADKSAVCKCLDCDIIFIVLAILQWICILDKVMNVLWAAFLRGQT